MIKWHATEIPAADEKRRNRSVRIFRAISSQKRLRMIGVRMPESMSIFARG